MIDIYVFYHPTPKPNVSHEWLHAVRFYPLIVIDIDRFTGKNELISRTLDVAPWFEPLCWKPAVTIGPFCAVYWLSTHKK
jgi:hypothetical protein